MIEISKLSNYSGSINDLISSLKAIRKEHGNTHVKLENTKVTVADSSVNEQWRAFAVSNGDIHHSGIEYFYVCSSDKIVEIVDKLNKQAINKELEYVANQITTLQAKGDLTNKQTERTLYSWQTYQKSIIDGTIPNSVMQFSYEKLKVTTE